MWNLIALFVFSFILLFRLLPNKRDFRLKACISTIFSFFNISHFSSKNHWVHFLRIPQRTFLLQNSLHMNPLKLLILLAWFVSIESWTCVAFPVSGTRIIRLIFDCYYYFMGILVLNQDLLMVLSSITIISGLFLKKKGPHLVHININSLQPKIDELWYIAKLSEAPVISISESKFDDSVLSSQIQIENYDLICSDRSRHGGGVACFIRNYLSYNTKSFLASEIENIFIDIFFTLFKASCCV